jgi:DNA-directed RNA polymerase specialized sigma24 family protein
MKTRIEPWDESFLDLEDFQVERAAVGAALEAIRQARRFGTSYVISENDQTKLVPPQETAPYEKQLLEDLERLNRRIAELRPQQESESDLVLRETPKAAKKP